MFPYPFFRFGIEINQKCNLHCDYCWNQKWNNKEINLEETELLLNELVKSEKTWLNNRNLIQVIFYAAEPLLSPEILFSLIEKFPFVFSIITNGTLIKNDVKEKLLYYNPNLLISLDGIEYNHNKHRNNSFDQVITNIISYDRYDKLNLAMTVNIDSLPYLYTSLAYMFSLPVAKFECHLNLYDNWTNKEFNQYMSILIKFIEDFSKKETLPKYSIMERFANISNAQFYEKDRGGPLHQLDVNNELLIEKPFRSCLLMPDNADFFYGKVFIKNHNFISEELKSKYYDFMKDQFTFFNYFSDNCEQCYFKNRCSQNRIQAVYLTPKECYPILESFILEELFWNKKTYHWQLL